jgi:hypothetical protein
MTVTLKRPMVVKSHKHPRRLHREDCPHPARQGVHSAMVPATTQQINSLVTCQWCARREEKS